MYQLICANSVWFKKQDRSHLRAVFFIRYFGFVGKNDKVIVLFDGVCILCNSIVNFLLRIDSRDNIRFATLQSEIAKNFVPQEWLVEPDSFLAIKNENIFQESAAVFEVIKVLPWYYRIALVFRMLPRSWTDKLYRYVARNRFRWFGKRDTCMIPTEEIRAKFL